MSKEVDVKTQFRNSIVRLIIWIVIYIIVGIVVKALVPDKIYADYGSYINIALALFFGYMIVSAFANTVYWSMRFRYGHPQAAAIRSIMIILGIGALLAGIAGGVAGGAAGVALGGFIGLVIGFATQQVLGQAIAGLFVLIVRPIKIGDYVTVAGETGEVVDVTSLFTFIKKDDGTLVLIPNNMLIGSKIYHIKKQQ
jgi:small-conductance mechanosensitive channel